MNNGASQRSSRVRTTPLSPARRRLTGFPISQISPGNWRKASRFSIPESVPAQGRTDLPGIRYRVAPDELRWRSRTAEKATRESEERFRMMADGCPAVMWWTNAKGGVQFFNRAYRELIGTTSEETAGNKWQQALHPEDSSEYLGAFRRAVRDRTPFHAEARARRADGEWRWMASYADPRFSPDGEFLGLSGVSLDLTERKRTEDALRQSHDSQRRQFADNSVAMLLIDPADGRIIDANDAALRFYGYPREQLLTMRASDLSTLTAYEVQHFLATVPRASGQLFQFKQGLADGSLRDVEVSSSLIQFGERRVLHAIVFDITARKRAEAALRESEMRHRLLFDGSRDAMLTLDLLSGKFTSANRAAVALYGARDEAALTKLGLGDVSPERQPDGSLSADKARETMAVILREGSHFFEWTHRRLDGANFHASIMLTKLEMAGQPFFQATVRDITADKLAEGKLRESEDRFRDGGRLPNRNLGDRRARGNSFHQPGVREVLWGCRRTVVGRPIALDRPSGRLE